MRDLRSGKRTALIVGLVGLAVLIGCSDREDGSPQTTSTSQAELAPATSVDLLERMNCDSAEDYTSNWYFSGPIYPEWIKDCSIDGAFAARLATFRTPEARAKGVDGYGLMAGATSSTSCQTEDGVPAVSWVVAGEDWMAIAVTEEQAQLVVERTGGQPADYSPTKGSVPSFLLPYPPCPEPGE